VRSRESRGIQFLSILFCSTDTSIWLYSVGASPTHAGNKPAAELLFGTGLSNTATDGTTSRSSESLREMPLNERCQRDCAAMGGLSCGDRRSVYLFAFAPLFVGQGPEQVSQLRSGVQVVWGLRCERIDLNFKNFYCKPPDPLHSNNNNK